MSILCATLHGVSPCNALVANRLPQKESFQ